MSAHPSSSHRHARWCWPKFYSGTHLGSVRAAAPRAQQRKHAATTTENSFIDVVSQRLIFVGGSRRARCVSVNASMLRLGSLCASLLYVPFSLLHALWAYLAPSRPLDRASAYDADLRGLRAGQFDAILIFLRLCKV